MAAFPLAIAAQPAPVASFSGVPPQAFIGEPVTFTVTFDNASPADAGYGPYIDLVLPAIGADGAGAAVDDGITFVGATYLGASVTSTVLTFDALGNATHPYARTAAGAPVVVTGTPGNQLVVLQLPFGSFTPSQPPVNVVVTTALSDLADVSTPLTLQARAGFQYGADALDNPSSDPSIVGSYANVATTPTVLRLRKTYIGPEDETATGPNFPRQYLIEVDIADGQTLTDLDLTDVLPPTLQFLSVVSTTIRGTVTGTTSVSTPSTSTPGGTLTRRFASVTGTTATNDATLLFSFYVPRVSASATAILDPSTGDDAQSVDDAQTQGMWDPIDGRDAPALATSNTTPSDHMLTDKSIAIQKSVAIVTDTGATGASPGDVLQYTLNVQVSDFFAFQNLVLTDILSDGLHEDTTFIPTLSVSEHGNTSSGNMAPANVSFSLDSPGSGKTTGTFSVSAELIARALNGVVLGGCVPAGGTGGPAPDCSSFNGGGTTVTIVYRAVIQDDYTDTFPSGDASVDEGDVLANDVTVAGDVLSVSTLTPTGSSESDDSHASVTIVQGELFKSIYAVNGSTTLPSPLRIGPGDTVTYQLRLTLPTSDIEPLTVTDYLPLPIFSATSVTTFDPTVSAAAPPSGQAKFGPTDTFSDASGLNPTLSSDATSNSLSFNYPQHDSPSTPSTVIDLLFTVTASDQPFADGLFLTNQANATQSTTQLESSTRDAIVQIQITEPDVRITKGLVATDAPSGVFAPATVGPVSFSAPGSPGYRGSGPITSTNLASTPMDSSLSGVDAGDLVTFALVLENRGNGVRGAFNVRVRDLLPAGFAIPGGGAGLNLRVTDGTGGALPFTNVGSGLFDPAGGIEITDGADGALGPHHPSNGLNIAVITFDLEVTAAAQPAQVLPNSATLFGFSGTETGPDHTTTDRTDSATVTVASPGVTKTIVTTNQAHTTGNNVAIGEQIQYQVVVRVPEGAADNVVLEDTLPLGLAIVSLDGLTASSGALTSSAGSFATIRTNAVVSNVGAGAENTGRRVTLDFGTLTNSDLDNGTAETITLQFTAVVINGGSNDRGDTRTNSATWSFTGGSASGSSPAVTIVEPTLQVAKIAVPASGDAGDPITFSVTLSHAAGSNATAFEAALVDVLPSGLTFVSATHTAGLAPTSLTTGGGFNASWSSFPVGSTSTIQLIATLDNNLASGQVLTNVGTSTWTSLPGVVTTPQSSFNTLSTERTGSAADPGGADNDHAASGQAAVTGLAAVPTKSIISTNLASTTGNNVAIGERVQYQVQVVVPEGVNTNVSLVDTLDAGLAFLSFDSLTSSSGSVTTSVGGGFPAVLTSASVSNVGGGAANDGRRVTFSLGTVTNSDNNNGTAETLTFVYTAVVINTAANVRGATRNNDAVWSSDGSSVTASAPNVTIVEPTLQIVKGVAPATADAGATLTFTLTVSHTGTSNAEAYDVAIDDAVPAGLTYVPASAAHTGGTAPTALNFSAGTLTASYASLPVGQNSIIQFQATLDTSPPVTPGQVITNTASLRWTSLPGTVTTPQSPFNTLSTERTGLTADPGGSANTYTANDSENVTVSASSLQGWVYVDTNGDGARSGGEPGIGGVTVRLTGTDHLGTPVDVVVTTQPNGSYDFQGLRPGTYTITEVQPAGYADGQDAVGTPALGGSAGNDVLGVMTIAVGSPVNGIDFNFGELSSSELSVTKTGTPDSVLPGGTITYTIQVTNAGPNAAANAVLTDPLPGGTTFVSVSAPGGWSCTTPSVGAAGTVSCTTASFAVGTVTFTLAVQADAGLAAHSVLRNVATITSASVDANPSNNQDDESTVLAAPGDADLEVTKVDSLDPASIGQTVSYTITVRNHGPATTDATVTDTVPAGLTFVSATPSAGSCSAVNPVVCTIPGITAGSTATITVQTTAVASGVAVNTVAVTGTQPDPNPTNDQASEPTTVAGPGETDLSITKSGPLTVARGGPLTYTIVVRNNGPSPATTVQVADALTLPGLTFVSNAGDCTTVFPCALGSLASGDTRTIVSTYTVGPAYAGPNPILNTATVSSATPESNLTNNTADVETLVADPSAADLTVTKVDSPDATVAGMPIRYTLVVTNNGPGTALGVTLTDALPAGVTFVSASPSQGSCSGTGPVSCTIGTLTNGANATIAIAVQSASALPTPNPIVNSATVSSTSADPEPANDTVNEPTTIVAQTDLQITKVAPATVTAGSPLVFTIVVTNAGPSDATNVVVADPTPAGLVFTSNGGDCATAFPCALGTVAAGQTRTITATFAVPSGYLSPNPIANTATVSSATTETNSSNNSASTSTTLVLDADLAIAKSGPATISAGNTITYTLVVTNNGPSDAATVQVSDPTPANLTFVGNAGDCATPFPCSFAALAAGQTRTITSTFLVPPGYVAPDPIVNTAVVSSATPDTNAANNTSTATTTLGAPNADLSVTKSGPAIAIPGSTVSYTIVVTNNGPADAAGVMLTDPTPTGLSFVSNAGDCTTAFPCALSVLTAGQTRTITSTFQVPASYMAPDPIVNTATVSSSTNDSNPANNTATATSSVGADLSLTKSASPEPVAAGALLTFTLVSTNGGAPDAIDLAIVDTVPAGTAFESATPSAGGACTTPSVGASSGTVTCTWAGATPAGSSRTLTLVVRVSQGTVAGSTIVNSATTSSLTNDPNPANNTASTTSTVTTSADLVVTKTVDRRTPTVGEAVTFTVTVRNAGPTNATGVAVVDAMPPGLTFLAANPSAGTYEASTGRWTIGALAVNATATLTLQARVDITGALVNTATITASDQPDPDTSNNTSGAGLNAPTADLQVQKTVDREYATVGTNVTFTITVRNAGPDAATGVEIAEVMPAGLTFLGATPSIGSYDTSTGRWTVGDLTVGSAATLAVTAAIADASHVTNTARVSLRDQLDPAPQNDSSGVSVNGDGADLQVVKTIDRPATELGDRVTFTIAVTNLGPAGTTNVRVRDVLPPALSFVSATASQGTYVAETAIWSVGALAAPGEGISSATLQITATVVDTGGGANTASVAGSDEPDPNPANDSNSAGFDAGAIDLDAELGFNGDVSSVGQIVDISVTVANRGSRGAEGPLVVAIPFPQELAFTAPQTNWPCEAVGRTLFCEHDLPGPLQHQTRTLVYWAEVVSHFPKGLAAYAHVLDAQDPNVANNVGGLLVRPPVAASSDLRVTQTIVSGGAAPVLGTTVTYRAEVTNLGPGVATDVTLIDALPSGLTLVSIVPEVGTCAGTRRLACSLGTLSAGQSVVVTIAAETTGTGSIGHTVTVSGRELDSDLTNNGARAAVTVSAASNPARDTDGDGLPDLWESQMGLNPALADAALDADGDGLTNAQEYAAGSHPRGFYRQFFAEGVANQFFGTMFSLLNPSATRDAAVAIELMRDTGEVTTTSVPLPALQRHDAGAVDLLGPARGSFATLVESDQPIATDRLTWWDGRGYGTGLESSLPAASTRWLFAEGATHGFKLFYLLQNPDMTQLADVTIRYLRPSGAPPVVRTYQVAAHSRLTIFVNEIAELTATDVSAEILSTRPIIAERAMYRDAAGVAYAAGHVGAGAPAPNTTWLFAEGATGDFLNLYLLLGNPNPSAASVDVRYLLPDGQTIVKTYAVDGNARLTIGVAGEDPRLASTSVGMTVTSSQPIVAERAMWWPGPSAAPEWYESHVALGATEAGTRWAVASGAAGGAFGEQTFILIANQATSAGRVRVTAILDDGTARVQELPIAATQRMTLDIAGVFPDAVNHTFSVLVESLGVSPVPIVVEGARYASPGGQLWGAGAAALGTRLQ